MGANRNAHMIWWIFQSL